MQRAKPPETTSTPSESPRGSTAELLPTKRPVIGIMHVMVGAGVHEASLSVMVARRAR